MKRMLIKPVAAALCLLFFPPVVVIADRPPFNILFILLDDLRTDLGSYGHPVVRSPNIDNIAKQGFVFAHAYAQQALCNPSRASMMTGLRPETLQIDDLSTNFRDTTPNAITLPQYLKTNGYETLRVGKVFHESHGNRDDPISWTVSPNIKAVPRYGTRGRQQLKLIRQMARNSESTNASSNVDVRRLPWEAPDVADDELRDGSLVSAAIKILEQRNDKPFFLAVGLSSPHLPFVSPKRYWELYDRDSISPPTLDSPPKGAPEYALPDSNEVGSYYGIPESRPLSDALSRELIHGYWSAISYADAQIGRLWNALDRLDLKRRTVVVVVSDQGYHLGEFGIWGKHTNYENAVRVPLVLFVPDLADSARNVDALIELVDVFPTLVEIVGLPVPTGLDGVSFKPLLTEADKDWKRAVFNRYPRMLPADMGSGWIEGRSIRTHHHRLIEWTVEPVGTLLSHELYRYDENLLEKINIANNPINRNTLTTLIRKLHAGWRKALPPE